MQDGVFQTDRAIFENKIWKQPLKFRLFFFIYGNAVFSELGYDIGGVHLKRGQYLRSYRGLQDDLEYLENHAVKRYSLSQLKRTIDELVSEKRLEIVNLSLGTLFTVINYEEYQGFDRFKNGSMEQRKNAVGTEKERSWNNNKKDKNANKELKDYSSELILMAEKLKSLILKNNPEAKTPDDLLSWVIEFEKMTRIDKRSPDKINTVIEFSQSDPFWKTNILSAKKLREQFDKLWLQKDRPKQTYQQKESPKGNFEQRKYTDDEIGKMYKEV